MARRDNFRQRGRQSSSTSITSTHSVERVASLQAENYTSFSRAKTVQEACSCFNITHEQLLEIMARMDAHYDEGLRSETARQATVKMLPAYIRDVSVGQERGKFLALDLGGTNFRVLLIELKGEKHSSMQSKIYRIPDNVMKGTGVELFDHIAACLAKFVVDFELSKLETKLPLGFTFSFPCQQEGLTSAILVNWTKGFNASGVVGNDVVQMLREACQRRGDIDVDVVAVLNDTTGTMLACSFFKEHCYIGVIVGTGCNAAYMESLDKIYKLQGKVFPEKDGLPNEMCVNTEWGGFGDDGALADFLTIYDTQLDENSINPGKQRFEKTISGMYLGELVRLVLEDLTRRGLITTLPIDDISQPGFIPTKLVSDIEGFVKEDASPFGKINELLLEKGVDECSPGDCAHIAYVCSMVSTRAAHLCACGIASLLKRVISRKVAVKNERGESPEMTVGVDGSVFRFHPNFEHLLNVKIHELLDGQLNGWKIVLALSEDGSGRGAAVAAAVATRMSRIMKEKKELEQASEETEGASATSPSNIQTTTQQAGPASSTTGPTSTTTTTIGNGH
uniref:Phosphotransferase n=1 Tax=Meloidogyne incognita TaxID=6306 RepID=A0A914NE62_MELIC